MQEKILEAAENLFLTRGYNGTSMRDIAEAVGYKSVAGLYNHFADKEAIFMALLESRQPYTEIFDLISTLPGTSAEEVLTHLFMAISSQMQQNMNFVRLVLIDFIEFKAAHVHHLIQQFQGQLAGVLQKVTTLDNLRPELSPVLIMRLMAVQVFGYVMTNQVMPPFILNALPEEAWKTQLIEAILHGITQEKKS